MEHTNEQRYQGRHCIATVLWNTCIFLNTISSELTDKDIQKYTFSSNIVQIRSFIKYCWINYHSEQFAWLKEPLKFPLAMQMENPNLKSLDYSNLRLLVLESGLQSN